MRCLRNIHFAVLVVLAFFATTPSRSQFAAPVRYRVIALAEPGHGLHQGFVDAALEFLEKGIDEHDFSLAELRTAPAFASLRQEPRFQALITKVGIPK